MQYQTLQRTNCPSILLTKEENDFVFSLLAPRCVVRLYLTFIQKFKVNRMFDRVVDEHGCGSVVFDHASSQFRVDEATQWSGLFCEGQLKTFIFYSGLLYEKSCACLGGRDVSIDRNFPATKILDHL